MWYNLRSLERPNDFCVVILMTLTEVEDLSTVDGVIPCTEERESWAAPSCIRCLLLTTDVSCFKLLTPYCYNGLKLDTEPKYNLSPLSCLCRYSVIATGKGTRTPKCVKVFSTPCSFADLKFKFWTWSLGLPDFWQQKMNTSLCSSEACISFICLFCCSCCLFFCISPTLFSICNPVSLAYHVPMNSW